MTTTGMVFDIQRFSLHDGPGIRSTVFLKGCPMRCWWCHNPEGQDGGVEMLLRQSRCIRCGACVESCPHGAVSWNGEGSVTDRDRCRRCGTCAGACCSGARHAVGREMTVSEVMSEVERDAPFYQESGGGVSISGGEPLNQPAFLGALLRACRERGFNTALDTCGHAPWKALDALRGFVDVFLYDLKLLDSDRHREFTGVGNDWVLANLQALARLGHRVVVRVPVIPGVNDDDGNVAAIGAFVAALPGPPHVDLLPWHRLGEDKYAALGKVYRLSETAPLSDGRVAAIAAALGRQGLEVEAGGGA